MNKILTVFLFTLLPIQPFYAQEKLANDTVKTLAEVIVTYRAEKLTPMTFQNISSKGLKLRSIGQEPSFLLSETPSITSYSDAGSSQGYSYFRLRGIDQTRINISLDGVSLNEPEDQGAYFSNYPDIFNSVSKIQLQRGVGTSKNGVASYGGSVQLFSPNLSDSTQTTFGFGYGSFNSERAFGEYNSGIKNKKALYIRASQIYSSGYKYNASNSSQSVFLSGGLFFDRSTWKVNLLLGHQQNQLAWLGVSDSLIAIDRRTNVNTMEKDRFNQYMVQVQNNWAPSTSSNLQTSVYYAFLKGDYDFNLNGFLGLPNTAELYNYAFESNLLGFFSNYTYSKNHFSWTTGLHGNVYKRQHIGSELTLGQLYQNTGYKNEGSLFSKADYTFNKVTFFADIQYRTTSFDYRGSVGMNKMHWNFLNPKAGVSVELDPHAVVYYSIGNLGREPTRNDLFGGSDDLLADSMGHALLSIKNPEYVLDHELGLRFLSRQFNFNLNLFYLDFKNEIVLDGKFGPNGLALTNEVSKSFRTGVELSLTYLATRNLCFINNSSFNYSRIKEQNERFSTILTPAFIINQEAVYSLKAFSLSVSARYQDKSYMDYANTATLNGYLLINSRLSYVIKNYQVSLFVNNITNAKYFNNGYVDIDGSKKYFVQAPLNFYGAIKYIF